MGGALLQLAAASDSDAFLTASPQITYFKAQYRRHSNFSVESCPAIFTGSLHWGSKITCILPRIGDMVGALYLEATLPSLDHKEMIDPGVEVLYWVGDAATDSWLGPLPASQINFAVYPISLINLFAYDETPTDPVSTNQSVRIIGTGVGPIYNRSYYQWVKFIGLRLIREASIEIGGQVIDRLYSDWLYIWAELAVPPGKQHGLSAMVGADLPQNCDSRTVIIPLPFWFCKNIGLSLPLISLPYHDVTLSITLGHEADMFRQYSPASLPSSEAKVQGLEDVTLWMETIFLDTDERRRFAKSSGMEYLIDTVTFNGDYDFLKAGKAIVPLYLSHPVIEVIWIAKGVHGNDPSPEEDWPDNYVLWEADADHAAFKYAARPDTILESCKITLNGADRFPARPGTYFTTVQPYQHHTNTQAHGGIHVYSFAVTPEDSAQPSGTLNFSRVDTATLELKIKHWTRQYIAEYTHEPITDDVLAISGYEYNNDDGNVIRVQVYSRAYNVLRIMGGLGGLAFST
jgi:hypothetical protein